MNFETFGLEHNLYLIGTFTIWFLVLFTGKVILNLEQRRIFVLLLIFITISQELIDDILRWNVGIWDVAEDLPLHMCGISFFTSTYALYSKNQTAFELSYFWGLAGAFQAIITPDPTRFVMDVSLFWNFLSHGLIILNVLWMIVIDNMRCRVGSYLNAIIITNGILFIISIVNSILGGNYWFICEKPGGESPFIMGEWPLYIIGFQISGILLLGLFYIPMIILRKKGKQFAISS
ncbi:MAG: TIGR02206 family membrane protein [Candidatus Marinimicrobia bacterium]|nr:TIGR02206 family membrane protein [Candidatus Neomarinimicrobiota bacterium]|tara:strand:- start:10042 stop:10743 length:702 start_codon:yes stop_codon:yes gene_type:complete